MNVMQLPIGKPLIQGYHFYAYPLAILAAHEEARPWIHSNYLQLCFYKDFKAGFPVPIAPYLYDYAACPWLSVQRIQRETVDRFQTSIATFLIESLQRGWYAYLSIDEYFIPRRVHYHQEHYVHDILVFGYDEEQRTFDVLGFCDDLTFAPSKVSFEEFEAAYHSLDQRPDKLEEFVMYRFNEYGNFQFDVRLVADLLEDYLLGRNTSERVYMFGETYDRAYGMDLYPYLKAYLHTLVEGEVVHDIKYLHIVWEHKKCVLALIRYLEEQGHLDPAHQFSSAFQQIEQTALTFRNAMFRYGMDEQAARLQHIIDNLEACAQEEAILLKRLIVEMRRGVAQTVATPELSG